MSGETTIIWDWNGTLLNDVHIALSTMNSLLIKYNLPILTENRYRDIFQFPVENYYIYAGFSFEKIPFQQLADQFIMSDSITKVPLELDRTRTTRDIV